VKATNQLAKLIIVSQSWVAGIYSVGQEIHCFLRNRKAHHHTQKSSPVDPLKLLPLIM